MIPPTTIPDDQGPAWIEFERARTAHLQALPAGSDTSLVPTFEESEEYGGFDVAMSHKKNIAGKQAAYNKELTSRQKKRDSNAATQKRIAYARQQEIYQKQSEDNLNYQLGVLQDLKSKVG